MKSPYEVILKPIVTEKGMFGVQKMNKYPFMVSLTANKIEIAKAIEYLYRDKGVKVVKVNTFRRKGKERRLRMQLGRTSNWKKAIVTFRDGDVIDLI
ncbi:MAG: 50S ribosomal protein L23 [Planctomycetota bacterium]